MTAIESMCSLLSLKYVGIFDYIKGIISKKKTNNEIYTRIAYFQKVI